MCTVFYQQLRRQLKHLAAEKDNITPQYRKKVYFISRSKMKGSVGGKKLSPPVSLLILVTLFLLIVLQFFYIKSNNCAVFESADRCYWKKSHVVNQSGLGKSNWPDLVLFVPVYPGGEHELNKLLLRTLKFFWPKDSLRLLFLVDEELPPATRDPFVDRIKNSMKEDAQSVHVKFNYVPREVFNVGHDRQQLIMLWADNFTTADYVGFLDDDSMISHHVLPEDIFDQKGISPNVPPPPPL